MIYALFAMVLGLAAILFSKFVMPKLQAKIEAQAAEQRAKQEAKKAAKAEAKKSKSEE